MTNRTIVCFGDSNTYGVVPSLARGGGHRYASERRWPGVVKKRLGHGWEVIEEGHPGRTTTHDDPIEGSHKNGRRGLSISLQSHMPIDLLILMLGTNDLKQRFSVGAGDIADSVEALVRDVHISGAGPGGKAPGVLLVAPPPMDEVGWLAEMFAGAREKSLRFPQLFAELAHRLDVPFLDSSSVVQTSAIDGVHLDSEAHRALGVSIAHLVLEMYRDVK